MQVNFKKLAAVAGICLGTAGGTAWASAAVSSIVGADGAINGCYQQVNGHLRVVAEGSACRDGELAIKWSTQGPKGDQGREGPVGPQGLKGDTGAQGIAGPTGPKGDQGGIGPAGATGLKGDKGDTGPAGPVGPAGLKGDTGADGAPGVQGPAGAQGPTGAKGDKGDRGDVGPAGPAVSGYAIVTSSAGGTCTEAFGCLYVAQANCPTGTEVLGGGISKILDQTIRDQQIGVFTARIHFNVTSRPLADGTGWYADYVANWSETKTVSTWAICADMK